MSSFARTRRGFTLIELLVVIAIIAILASILFPMFYRAREAGRRARCCQQMKQIQQAIAMYSGDWQGRMPWADYLYCKTYNPADIDPLFVGKILLKYEKNNMQVWKCPSNPAQTSQEGYCQVVYYFNLFRNPFSADTTFPDPYSLAGQSFDNPGHTINWMTDKNNQVKSWGQTRNSRVPVAWDQRVQKWDYLNKKFIYDANNVDATYRLMHYDGWNILFLDGHIKYKYQGDRSGFQPE